MKNKKKTKNTKLMKTFLRQKEAKKIKCIFLYNQNKNKTINVIDHKVVFGFE